MELRNRAIFISVMFGLAIFLLMIVVIAVTYDVSIKKTRYAKDNPKDWLFYRFNDKFYNALFGRKDEDEVALKLGIKVEDYYKNCEIVRQNPDMRNIVTKNIYGIAALVIFFILTFLFNPLFFLLGAGLYYINSKYPIDSVKSKAKDMRMQAEKELPQFLDLLAAELAIGLPIDRAIEILCMKYDGLLSKEFLEALNDSKLGESGGWQGAIEKVASKYDVEMLSDFVLDVTVAFNKGISVAQSVRKKNEMITQKHKYAIKERAGRAENTILIPIALLQFIPMVIFILLPSLSTLSNL